MKDCIFCKLANGDIPTEMVYQDGICACFKDANPQAPVHLLLVPKVHIKSLNDVRLSESEMMAHLMLKIKDIAKDQGLDEGYRVVINVGDAGGQTVPHLHIHILGKRAMQWPPG